MSGTAWAWGSDATGVIGGGVGDNSTSSPVQMGVAENWTKISVGNGHVLALRDDGTLWACGTPGNGQLGNGTFSPDVHELTQIGTDTDWADIAAGYEHSLALKVGGTLWACGANAAGEVGDGSFTSRSSFVQIGTDTDWNAITAGFRLSAALKTNGTLWTWGSDSGGALGNGAPTGDVNAPAQIGVATYKKIACGTSHMHAIATNDTLWAWGTGASGVLGLGDTSARTSPTQVGASTWLDVDGGDTHTLAVNLNGTLWSCGNATNGRLGNGLTTPDVLTITQVGVATNWESVSAGVEHSAARTTSGTIFLWGRANAGRLGNGTTTPDVLVPTQLGADIWDVVAAAWGAFTAAIKYVAPPPNPFWTDFAGTAELE